MRENEHERWQARIARAKKVRTHWKELFKVDLAREYIDGKQMPPGQDANDWITINTFYSHLRATLPALYSADPYFYVTLRHAFTPHPEEIALYESKGKIRQAGLNYFKDVLKLKEKARLGILDAHFAYGVLKVRYSADEVDNPDAGKPIVSEDGETTLTDDNGMELKEPEKLVTNGVWKTERIHPDDFLWDEDAGPLEDSWHWVAQRVREPLSSMKKNKTFSRKAIRSLEGKASGKDDEEKTRESRKKGDVKGDPDRSDKKGKVPDETIARWEIYNLRDKTWLVIAEDADDFLVKEGPLPKGIDDHPFTILRFFLRDDSPYPHPPLSAGIDPCKEYNIARSDIQKHRKRFNRKYEVNITALEDENEVSKLETGEDGTLIRKRTMETAVTPIQDAQLDPMRYQELAFLKAEMTELLGGATDEARGIAGAESATQAGILDKRLEMKEGDAMSMVVDWVREWARKCDKLVQTYLDTEMAVKVKGPQGEVWEILRPGDYEEIRGEYAYSVNVGATIPRLPQMERASWTAFLSLLAQFPHLMTQKHLMKRMAEMHHIEDEVMLEELYQLGKQILGGQVPYPGATGSQPGVGEDRPVSAMGGQASGGIASGIKALIGGLGGGS